MYVRAGGTTELVSAGPLAVDQDFLLPQFAWAIGGRKPRLLHHLRAVDARGHRRHGQRVRVLRWRFGAGGSRRAAIAGISADGTRVFVVTDEPLLPSDTDTGCNDSDIVGCEDVYEIHGGKMTPDLHRARRSELWRRRRVREPLRASGSSSTAASPLSADGTRVLFWHDAPLLAGDTDSSYDVYLASAGPVRSDYRNAQRFCRAERSFLGAEAFRERYG